MKSIRFLLAALAAAVAITCLAQGAPAFADNSGNKNETPYWESQLGNGATCVKHNPGDSTTDGTLTDGGTSVTLSAGSWVLLVVNSGSGGQAGDGNLVYQNPTAGTAYVGPVNGGQQQGLVSHWIVCSRPVPQPPAVITVNWTDGPADCAADTVTQTELTTTTLYVLVGSTWQLDTAHAVTVPTNTKTRTLTPDELTTCAGPQPPAVITVNWTDGPADCAADTVTQTELTTTTLYVLVGSTWQLDTAHAVTVPTNTKTRTLTPDELTTCAGPQPPAVITVNWTDGPADCAADTVTQTELTTTTLYVLVGSTWQLDTAHAVTVPTNTKTRTLTPDELTTCAGPQPPAVITVNWTDGPADCAADTVTQTELTTTTLYVLVGSTWQLDTAHAVTVPTNTKTRTLTPDELTTCAVVVPTQSPAFVEATCTADAELVLPETTGVTYTPSGPAAAGATVTVVATPQQGFVLSGQTQWTHTFTTLAAIQCLQSEPTPPADTQTGSQQGAIDTPTQTDQSASEAPATTPAPTTQLPKTGNDHVTLLALIAAVLLGGGVALSGGGVPPDLRPPGSDAARPGGFGPPAVPRQRVGIDQTGWSTPLR